MGKKIILIALLLFVPFQIVFGQNLLDQVIIIHQPQMPSFVNLNLPDTSVVKGGSFQINLRKYTNGSNKDQTSYSIGLNPNRLKLWELEFNTSDYIRNYSVDGNMVSCGQTAREIGMGMKPNNWYSFKIPPGYTKARGYVGHDEEGGIDTAGISIYGDSQKLFEAHGLYAWDNPKIVDINISGYDSLKVYTFGATPQDHISFLDFYVDKDDKMDARIKATLTSDSILTVHAMGDIPIDTYKLPITVVDSSDNSDTDSLQITVTEPTYSYQIMTINNGSSNTLYDYPVMVSVIHHTGMRSDFGDVEFFRQGHSDTLWADIFQKFDSDSAYFIVRVDTLSPGNNNLEYRYAFSNHSKNKYNNDLFLTNFYEDGKGIPSHLMAQFRDTTSIIRVPGASIPAQERGYIVVDSTGKYYFFATAGKPHPDETVPDGMQVYLYTSTDSGKTWTSEHDGDPIWDNHWGEDVMVFKNPFTTKTQWVAYSEDESRGTIKTRTTSLAYYADSLMQAKWTYAGIAIDTTTDVWQEYQAGTPGAVIFKDDTLWVFYEAIGRYNNGNHMGTLCLAYATDSASVFQPTYYSGNPVQGSPDDNLSSPDWVENYSHVTDRILWDGHYYHEFAHDGEPYYGSTGSPFFATEHFVSKDFKHWNKLPDPDTSVVYRHLIFYEHQLDDCPIYDEKNPWDYFTNFNSEHRWVFDWKWRGYYHLARWGGSLYNGRKVYLGGDTLYFSNWFYHWTNWDNQNIPTMYLQYEQHRRGYRYSTFVRPLTGAFSFDAGIISRSGSGAIVAAMNGDDRIVVLENTNSKWRVRIYDDSGDNTLYEFSHSYNTYYRFHIEFVPGSYAKVYVKNYTDGSWTYGGQSNSVYSGEPNRIAIGNIYMGDTDCQNVEIPYISISQFDPDGPAINSIVGRQ